MKKIITILLLLNSMIGVSQIVKNKLAIDLSMEYNPFVGFEDTAIKRRNFTVGLNYRLSRRVSLDLLASYNKYNYSYNSIEIYEFNNSTKQTQIPYGFHKFSMALGLNYSIKKRYAPIGSSIGIFYKINKNIVDNYNNYYAYLRSVGEDEYETNQKIIYSVSYIGFKVNLLKMLSNKVPVYLKYGASFAVPIKSYIQDKTISETNFKEYYSVSSEKLNDGEQLKSLKTTEYFKFNIGIGYLF